MKKTDGEWGAIRSAAVLYIAKVDWLQWRRMGQEELAARGWDMGREAAGWPPPIGFGQQAPKRLAP